MKVCYAICTKTVSYTSIDVYELDMMRQAVVRLSNSLNKITDPSTCAVALTDKAAYFGNNVFLSNDTLVCAEASALANAAAAGDRVVHTLLLVITRSDSEPSIVSPCGNCRQWLHDFARLNKRSIKVLLATSKLDKVACTDSDELLPDGFKSAGLGRMVGAA